MHFMNTNSMAVTRINLHRCGSRCTEATLPLVYSPLLSSKYTAWDMVIFFFFNKCINTKKWDWKQHTKVHGFSSPSGEMSIKKKLLKWSWFCLFKCKCSEFFFTTITQAFFFTLNKNLNMLSLIQTVDRLSTKLSGRSITCLSHQYATVSPVIQQTAQSMLENTNMV